MLPISGPLSLFAIFEEIYGRDPNIGERVSYHDLVDKSYLTDKSFPCPFSRFYRSLTLSKTRITLRPDIPSATFTLESSGSWRLITTPAYVIVDYTEGAAGVYVITVSSLPTEGVQPLIFQNTISGQQATLTVINSTKWVLDTGQWNMLGVWYNNGIWKGNVIV